jgi:hypothetical protein
MAEREGFEPSIQVLARITVWQIQPVPYLLHGINQLRSPQVPSVGQNQGVRPMCMHLNMHLFQRDSAPRTETVANRFVTRSVSELRPHPAYAELQLSVSSAQFASIKGLGEPAFKDPLLVTRQGVIMKPQISDVRASKNEHRRGLHLVAFNHPLSRKAMSIA